MQTNEKNTVEDLIKFKAPSILTVFYKSDWQFCMMIEKSTQGVLSYSEYDFDKGTKPWLDNSQCFEMELPEKKHKNFDLYLKRVQILKHSGYKVKFSELMEAEKLSLFLESCVAQFDKVKNYLVHQVAIEISERAQKYGINLILCQDHLIKKQEVKPIDFIKTFQNYITPVSILLIQAHRQKLGNLTKDCINTIWFFVFNGCFNTSIFEDNQLRMKQISTKCFTEDYNSIWRLFSSKSDESKELVANLENIVNSKPDQIQELVDNFKKEQPKSDIAIELLDKYHLTMK